jgi:mannose-6-phosphate isomerase-like protein (cupin superfamily)
MTNAHTGLIALASIAFSTSSLLAQTATKVATVDATPAPPPRIANTLPNRAETLPMRVDYVPQGRYDDIRDEMVRAHGMGGTLFSSPDGETSYMMVMRKVASNVEEHSRWDDLIFVKAGSGYIEVGRKSKGARFLAAGELRGGTILKAERLEAKPGDIVRIPAGIPHAFVPNAGTVWEYLVVKVHRTNKPLKRPPAISPAPEQRGQASPP